MLLDKLTLDLVLKIAQCYLSIRPSKFSILYPQLLLGSGRLRHNTIFPKHLGRKHTVGNRNAVKKFFRKLIEEKENLKAHQ